MEIFPQLARVASACHAKISKVTVPGSVNLSVNVGALRLTNPIIAASGTFGYGVEFAHLVDLNRLVGIVVNWRSLARSAKNITLLIKMSPNVTEIAALVRAAQDAGEDALTVANTYQGMSVDTRTRTSRLGRLTGGIPGQAIRPIPLRLVYESSRAVK